MDADETSVYLLLIVAVVAVVGLGLGIASFAWNESVGSMMGGGGPMMGNPGSGTSSGPGAVEWAVLVASAAFFLLAVALLVRGRASRRPMSSLARMAYGTTPPLAISPVPASEAPMAAPISPAVQQTVTPPVAEPTLVKLLSEDERRMYLELRDHGGQMFQRDLVALGVFSKAKVTRVLDKLEAKGLIVREAHGMTNRVRLVNPPAR